MLGMFQFLLLFLTVSKSLNGCLFDTVWTHKIKDFCYFDFQVGEKGDDSLENLKESRKKKTSLVINMANLKVSYSDYFRLKLSQ